MSIVYVGPVRSTSSELTSRPSTSSTAARVIASRRRAAGERQFSSVYYDSEDALLASVGITFRRRTEHGGSLWQLKLPRSEGRLELEEAGGPVAPPERFVTLLAAVLRERTLAPVAELRTIRRGVRMRANGSTADVVLDEVAVMDNLRVVSEFDELEIELVDGEPDGLEQIEVAVRSAGAGDGDPRPKVLRVLGHSRPAKPSRPQLQAFFQRQYEQILAHDPGTRLGDDPEDLHDLRVAARRLRAILKVAAPPLDGAWADELRAELDWLGDALWARSGISTSCSTSCGRTAPRSAQTSGAPSHRS